jgi:hypothetical protein
VARRARVVRKHEASAISERILRDAGINDYELGTTGRSHIALRFRFDGRRHSIFMSSTPSDHRVLKKQRAFMLRTLRRLGAME